MIVLVRPVAAAVGVGQVSSFKTHGYHHTSARNHAWIVSGFQLFQLQQLHCTSRPAMAPPVLLQGQEEQSGRLGGSWHVEYHPRVIMPWNIASKRATAITTLTNYV